MKKLTFICFYLCSTIIFAQAAGTVLFTTNKVIAERNNKQRLLARGATFYVGDSIRTEAEARAQIKYSNGTLVSIEPNSEYKILEYKSGPASTQNKAKLSHGAIESSTKGQKKESLQTNFIALAIVGTQFKVIAETDKTYLEVTQGQVIGGSEIIGPKQQYSSGFFDRAQKFRPGLIPWDDATGQLVEDRRAAAEVLDAVNEAINTNLVSSIANAATESIILTTEIAEIEIL